jgi:hypothetical protein
MAFSTKQNLSNDKFGQITGSTLTLSGDTVVANSGKLRYSSVVSITGETQIVHKSYVDDLIIGVTGGTILYDGATPATIQVGGITAGTQLTGRTANDILEQMLVVYQLPAFTAFSVTAQNTTVETGTVLSGSKTFTWTTSNAGNVATNSIGIRDNTSGATLATGLANDGSEALTIATNELDNGGDTQVWSISGTNTQAGTFNTTFTVTGRFLRFYGPSASSPANSAAVRALPTNAFQTANANTFTLNTGNVETKMVVALPQGRTIASVFDIDAANANITASYVLTGTIAVSDNGGSGPTTWNYNIYELNLGEPYSSSHAHSITTA